MGKVFEHLDLPLIEFISRQKMFFVATAPLSAGGHVNVSPKGYDTFSVIDPKTVAWADLGGSGVETVSHLRENGRICIMFCAFDGAARILRLHGRGRVTQFDEPGFAAEAERFSGFDRIRSIITVDLTRIADSCGWGVPLFDFRDERNQLTRALSHPAREALHDKWRAGNASSLDGLPGVIPTSGD